RRASLPLGCKPKNTSSRLVFTNDTFTPPTLTHTLFFHLPSPIDLTCFSNFLGCTFSENIIHTSNTCSRIRSPDKTEPLPPLLTRRLEFVIMLSLLL
ncbi:hypothetical protein KSS87_000636, partial [Heliosperma pusillum]